MEIKRDKMEKMITIRVTAEQHQQVKVLAAELGMSIKEIFWLGVEQAEKEKAWKEGDKEGKSLFLIQTMPRETQNDAYPPYVHREIKTLK